MLFRPVAKLIPESVYETASHLGLSKRYKISSVHIFPVQFCVHKWIFLLPSWHWGVLVKCYSEGQTDCVRLIASIAIKCIYVSIRFVNAPGLLSYQNIRYGNKILTSYFTHVSVGTNMTE